MFCKYCGNKIDEGNKFCTACGAKVEERQEDELDAVVESIEQSTAQEQPKKKLQGLGLAGFIVSLSSMIFFGTPLLLITAIVGLILSAVALKKFNKETHKLKGFAISGLVIGIVIIGIFLLALMFACCTACLIATTV